MEPLMNKEQLAARLGVPVGWVVKAITARTIPITWIGKHPRFTEADYAAICDAGHEVPKSAVADLLTHRRRRAVA